MRLPTSSIFQNGQASQAVRLDPERNRAPLGKVQTIDLECEADRFPAQQQAQISLADFGNRPSIGRRSSAPNGLRRDHHANRHHGREIRWLRSLVLKGKPVFTYNFLALGRFRWEKPAVANVMQTHHLI
jgi:hypothetical protein